MPSPLGLLKNSDLTPTAFKTHEMQSQTIEFSKFPRGASSRNLLTIIPRARMGYELIAHEAEGRMGY